MPPPTNKKFTPIKLLFGVLNSKSARLVVNWEKTVLMMTMIMISILWPLNMGFALFTFNRALEPPCEGALDC